MNFRILKNIAGTLLSVVPKKNRIVFSNFYGSMPGDNPLYVWQRAEKFDIESVWLVNDVKTAQALYPNCEHTKFVKFRSLWQVYYLVTSRVWIDNVRKPWTPPKKKGQIYIQTWHGEPLKAIEEDALSSLEDVYVKWARNDSASLDYVISGSKLSKDVFEKSFWLPEPKKSILSIGEPRWEEFRQKNNYDKLNETLGLSADDKVILYMPTFRDSNKAEVNFDYQRLIKQTEGKFKILVRQHPNVITKDNSLFNNQVINVSNFGNPQTLIGRADVVITDYSSSMFDAMVADKKVVLLARDLRDYLTNNRRMYIDYEKLPFPIFEDAESFYDYFAIEKNLEPDLNRYRAFESEFEFTHNSSAVEQIFTLIHDSFK